MTAAFVVKIDAVLTDINCRTHEVAIIGDHHVIVPLKWFMEGQLAVHIPREATINARILEATGMDHHTLSSSEGMLYPLELKSVEEDGATHQIVISTGEEDLPYLEVGVKEGENVAALLGILL